MTPKAAQPSKASRTLVLVVCITMLTGIFVPLTAPTAGASYKDYKVLRHLSGANSGEYVSWSPDGKFIVSQTASNQQADFSFRYWRTSDWGMVDVPTQHDGIIYAFAWSPDSARLATVYRSLIIFNVTNNWAQGDPLPMPGNQMARAVGWNPTKSEVAVGTELGLVLIVNTQTLKVEKSINASTGWIERVVYSPNSKLLAVSDLDGVITIYDASTWKLKWTLNKDTQDVHGLAWRPDSTQLVSTSFDSNIYLWDMTDGSFVKLIGGHGPDISVFDVKWSPVSDQVITGGASYVCVWDGTTFDLLQKIETGNNGASVDANSLSWGPQGDKFATSGSKGIDIWSPNVPASSDPLSQLTSYICGALLLVIIVGLGSYAAYQYYQRKKLETEDEEGSEEEEPEEEPEGEEKEEEEDEDAPDKKEEEEEAPDEEDDEDRRQRRKDRRKGQRKKGW